MKTTKLILIAVPLLLAAACSTSNVPAVGSPEWLWVAARDSYVAGDMDKACAHLEKIERQGNNPYVERARIWRMVVEAGMASGHLELGQAYSEGRIHSRTNKLFFSRQRSDHLKEAKRYAIGLAEAYGALTKQPLPKTMVLEFPFPKGSGADVADLDGVYKGTEMPEAQRLAANEKTLDRGMVRAVSAVLTTADDSPGAQKALQSGRAELPSARVLLALGTAMEKLSAIFNNKNLDEPDKLKIFHERAQDAAKRVLEMEPEAPVQTAAKKLQADIEKTLKAEKGKAPPRR